MKRYVFDLPDFIKVDDQPIGTHSLCKLPVTFAKRNNCIQDEIDMVDGGHKVHVLALDM